MCDHKEYSLEPHKVTSEDGYISTLFRVVKNSIETESGDRNVLTISKDGDLISQELEKRKVSSDKVKPQVLLVHGLNCTGLEWTFHTNPDKVLPFMLLEQGYDCWLASLRGSKHSRAHESMNTKSRKYWDFSYHEMGYYDVPALMDYILKTSGSQDLFYIGHSMGCAVFFISMILRPDYIPKIRKMVALAPCVYGNHVRLPLINFGGWLLKFTGKMNILYSRKAPIKCACRYARMLCPPFLKINTDRLILRIMKAGGSLSGVCVKNGDQMDKAVFLKAGETVPASSSIKVTAHILQCYTSGHFQAYDHGRRKNLKRYGEAIPPMYDLSKVHVPIMVICSAWDQLVPEKDVAQVVQELPNVLCHTVIQARLGHADFMMGKDAPELVYERIIEGFKDL